MAKYNIQRSGGPAYQEARNSAGLHVHVDASIKYESAYAGIIIERRSPEATVTLSKKRTGFKTLRAHVAELRAIRFGISEAMKQRQDSEHLFLYTDSEKALRALYGQTSKTRTRADISVSEMLEMLPSPTEYSIILCDSEVNPADEIA